MYICIYILVIMIVNITNDDDDKYDRFFGSKGSFFSATDPALDVVGTVPGRHSEKLANRMILDRKDARTITFENFSQTPPPPHTYTACSRGAPFKPIHPL